jgi:hypothetical protein
MKAELSRIGDLIAIRELTGRYNLLLDELRVPEFVALWTPDGEFRVDGAEGVVLVAAGRDALAELVEGRGFGSVHIAADSLIDIDGDDAAQECRVILGVRSRDRAIGSSNWVTSATYSDRLTRTEVGWRFAARTFRPDALIDEPFPPISSE